MIVQMDLVVTAVLVITVSCLCFLLRGFARTVYLASKLPGPTLWELVTVHLKNLVYDEMSLHVHTWRISEAYGYKPWCLWLYHNLTIVISDQETVSEVMKSRNFNDKPTIFYQDAAKYLGDGLLTLNGAKYRRHRKLLNPAFRKGVLESQLHIINQEAGKLVVKLQEHLGEDRDFRHTIEDSNIYTSIMMFSSGCFTYPNVRELKEVTEYLMYAVHLKSINPVYYWCVYKWLKSTRENEAKSVGVCEKALKEISVGWAKGTETRIHDNSKSLIFLDYLLRANLEMGDAGLTEAECYDEVMTVFAAAAETSSYTTNVLLMLLAIYPEVQQKVYEEIQSADCADRAVEPEDLSKLVYLDMVLKETLRLFPPVPIIGRVAAEESTLNNITVPKGTNIMVNLLALHRNPSNFKDPLKFDPDRFHPVNSEGRHPSSFLPFSAGYRSCPGQLHAFILLKTYFCHILSNFQVLPGDKLRSIDDLKIEMAFVMHLRESSLRFVRRIKC